MRQTRKLLISIGTALAASKLVRTISGIEFDDLLGTVGIERRRSCAMENLVLIGVGAALGAGTAMLLTPLSGRETRQRISEQASRLSQAAKEVVLEHKDDVLHALAEVASGTASSSPAAQSHKHG